MALCLLVMPARAQQLKAWVFFDEKENTCFDSGQYFTQKNLQRKQLQQLPAYDWYDLPVNAQYPAALIPYCDSITFVSRWLNAACVYTSADRLAQIERLAFVRSVEPTELAPVLMEKNDLTEDLHQGELNLLHAQTARMQGHLFRQRQVTGANVAIAIIDGGFNGYLKNESLARLRSSGRIKHTYDYVKKRHNVDAGSTHGTSVLSCIAGYINDSIPMGCAPDATILLYRTEKAFNEKMSEEEHWMAAMEEADRQGADIINASLGYSTRRYFQQDMNGRKSLLARAANIASRKGILVVCSAGNEGDISWKTICTPGDADSALTVGAINPWTGIQASWSSYGPSADQRLKPNVCAYGYAMTAKGATGLMASTGTSFSSPLVAGFAACARQLYPNLTAYELLQKIEQAGDLYPYFDYAHGYGVPQASRIFETSTDTSANFTIETDGDSLRVIIDAASFVPAYLQVRSYYVKDTSALYTEVQGEKFRKSVHFNDNMYTGTGNAFVYSSEPGYFYYSIGNDTTGHMIDEYGVLNVRQRIVYRAKKTGGPRTFTFHYRGYTRRFVF